MVVFDAENERYVSIKKQNDKRSPVERGAGPACEFCNDTGEKVDHVVEGSPAAATVFCDCPAGDAVRELFDEIKVTK